MNTRQSGQSLCETVFLNLLIAGGLIAVWSICQSGLEKYLILILDLIAKPSP